MRAVGHLCLWGGFLGAAFCSVSRLEQTDKWSTIPWSWYSVSMFVGIAGIAVLRRARGHDHADEAKTEAEYGVIRQSLDAVASGVQLASQSEHAPSEVLRVIDQQCAEPLSDFADSRQALVKRFGLHVYAEVMTEFAAAERYINRAWSAAADGYVDEIHASLNQASQFLANARELLAEAERTAHRSNDGDRSPISPR